MYSKGGEGMIRDLGCSQVHCLDLVAKLGVDGLGQRHRFGGAQYHRLHALCVRSAGDLGAIDKRSDRAQSAAWGKLLLVSHHRVERRVFRLAQISPQNQLMRVVIRPSHLETVMHAALAEAALTRRESSPAP